VPVVTRALIGINALVFFYELALPDKSLESLFYLFGIVPARFTDSGRANRGRLSRGWLLGVFDPSIPARRLAAYPQQYVDTVDLRIGWPSSAEWALGTIVGASMLFGGVARLMITLAARSLVSEVT